MMLWESVVWRVTVRVRAVLNRWRTGQVEKEAMGAAGVCLSGTINCGTAKDCRAGNTSTANSGSAAASSIAEGGEATAAGVRSIAMSSSLPPASFYLYSSSYLLAISSASAFSRSSA